MANTISPSMLNKKLNVRDPTDLSYYCETPKRRRVMVDLNSPPETPRCVHRCVKLPFHLEEDSPLYMPSLLGSNETSNTADWKKDVLPAVWLKHRTEATPLSEDTTKELFPLAIRHGRRSSASQKATNSTLSYNFFDSGNKLRKKSDSLTAVKTGNNYGFKNLNAAAGAERKPKCNHALSA